jgi:hypothetical protein
VRGPIFINERNWMKCYKWEHKNYFYFSENKKKSQETEDTRNCSTVYRGVKQNIKAQSGAVQWTYKTLVKAIITSFGMAELWKGDLR